MTVGDPRKALVLGTVAIVVVCVAVYRALPSAPAPVAPRPADASQTDAQAALEDIVAESVSVDPFSHPDLEKVAEKQKENETKPDEKPTTRTTPSEFRVKVGHDRTEKNSEFEPLPAINTTGNLVDLSAGIPFRVEAVVRGDEALALVSLANTSGIAVRVGTTLNSHVKIAEIKSGSVVIEASGKRIEVAVGEGVSL